MGDEISAECAIAVDRSGQMGSREFDVDACSCTLGGANREAAVGTMLTTFFELRADHRDDILLGLINDGVLHRAHICYEPL